MYVQALRLCTGRMAHKGSRGIVLLFLDHGARRRWGVNVRFRPLFTPRKTRYALYRRLGGPQGRSGQVRKISPPPGFDPLTVQPVASRYTDWAIGPIQKQYVVKINLCLFLSVVNETWSVTLREKHRLRVCDWVAEEDIWVWEGRGNRAMEKTT